MAFIHSFKMVENIEYCGQRHETVQEAKTCEATIQYESIQDSPQDQVSQYYANVW